MNAPFRLGGNLSLALASEAGHDRVVVVDNPTAVDPVPNYGPRGSTDSGPSPALALRNIWEPPATVIAELRTTQLTVGGMSWH